MVNFSTWLAAPAMPCRDFVAFDLLQKFIQEGVRCQNFPMRRVLTFFLW
jgi:hypothetical protein